mmetsp:Transcript_43025/g.129179  ORF Transcript_43025/g.129179 Transcript_43025/m.129179 type:complete len:226 (-) Transcript_43025:4340-5017(-)
MPYFYHLRQVPLHHVRLVVVVFGHQPHDFRFFFRTQSDVDILSIAIVFSVIPHLLHPYANFVFLLLPDLLEQQALAQSNALGLQLLGSLDISINFCQILQAKINDDGNGGNAARERNNQTQHNRQEERQVSQRVCTCVLDRNVESIIVERDFHFAVRIICDVIRSISLLVRQVISLQMVLCRHDSHTPVPGVLAQVGSKLVVVGGLIERWALLPKRGVQVRGAAV